jgi:hypothetical protein
MKIKTIIIEEYLNIILENYSNINNNNMNIQNLIDIVVEMSRNSNNDILDRNIVAQILMQAEREGEKSLINMFKGMTNLDIYSIRKGKYSFTPQVTPTDYEEKLE